MIFMTIMTTMKITTAATVMTNDDNDNDNDNDTTNNKIYDMIWYDMIWYDMIWYDMIWYDMIYDEIYDIHIFILS